MTDKKELLERLGTKYCQMCGKPAHVKTSNGYWFCDDCAMNDYEQRLLDRWADK